MCLNVVLVPEIYFHKVTFTSGNSKHKYLYSFEHITPNPAIYILAEHITNFNHTHLTQPGERGGGQI